MQREPFDPEVVPRRDGNGQPFDSELERLAAEVIGAAIEVHRMLRAGYPESVYEEAVSIELRERGIRFELQTPFQVRYKGQPVGQGRLDLLVEGVLVVELQAVEALAPIHTAQVITYLRASNQRLGLLINFNVRLLRDGVKRVII